MANANSESSKLTFDRDVAFQQLGFSYQSLLGKGGWCEVYAGIRQGFYDEKCAALCLPNADTMNNHGNLERITRYLLNGFDMQKRTHELGGYVPEPFEKGVMQSPQDVTDHVGVHALTQGLSGVAYPYMMMECIGSGLTLGDVIASHIRSIPFAVRALMRIARTVEIMNTNEMYHGDLKPTNILIDRELCYLGDFGLAQYMNGCLKGTTHLRGTPSYMSWRYVTKNDPSDLDQYALALILYETITGMRLIKLKEITEQSVANAARNLKIYPLDVLIRVFKPDRDLAKALDEFFAVALAQDEQQHHTNVSSMVSHLGEIWVKHVVPRGEEVVETQRLAVGEIISRKAKARATLRSLLEGSLE